MIYTYCLKDRLYLTGFVVLSGCGLAFIGVGAYYIMGDYSLKEDQSVPTVFGAFVMAKGGLCLISILYLTFYFKAEMVEDRRAFWHGEIKDREERCNCKKVCHYRCAASDELSKTTFRRKMVP